MLELIPNAVVLGNGVFGKWLGPSHGALVNGISVLIRAMRADAFSLLCLVRKGWPGSRQALPHQTLDLAGTLILEKAPKL